MNRDTADRPYEAKKWQELLDKAVSQCYLNMADDAQLLFGDTLTIRKVTILSTGSTMCWRISANLADHFWLSETNDEHTFNALFAFVTVRIHNLAAIKNFVRESDVFGNSRYTFDLIPPDRCPLCRPLTAERSMGGLPPSMPRLKQLARDARPQSPHESPPSARVEPKRRTRRKRVPPNGRGTPPPETPPPPSKPDSKELSRKKKFPDLTLGVSENWANSMRPNLLGHGFFAAYCKTPEDKKDAALEVADRLTRASTPTKPRNTTDCGEQICLEDM